MKTFKFMHVVMMIALVTLLATGCAKEAPKDQTVEPPKATTTQETPKQIEETPVMEVKKTINDLTMVHFDFDSYVLSSEAQATLRMDAAILKEIKTKVKIEGHCDERGSDDYNLALGQQRAEATMNFLRQLGVSASQMEAVSKGENEPLDPASNEAAWAKNRRAQFVKN